MSVIQILSEELEALKSDIITLMQVNGKIASGKTRDSLEVKTQGYSGQLLGASYSGVLERGRKPGRVPYNFQDILRAWAAAKGISFASEQDAARWANAVKWKIIREGTALYRSGHTDDIFTTPVNQFTERLTNRILGYYEQETINKIFDK